MVNLLDLGCPCGCGRLEMDTEVIHHVITVGVGWDHRANAPMLMVTSGFRCLYWDWRQNQNSTSTRQHTRGKAVDFARVDGQSLTDGEAAWLRNEAIRLGATGIGLYNRSIHMDWREDRFLEFAPVIEGKARRTWNERTG